MDEGKYYYWIAGEDGDDSDPRYFNGPEDFLEYLRDNEPVLCGATRMTHEEWDELEDADDDSDEDEEDETEALK
jgi:hypothetical protein